MKRKRYQANPERFGGLIYPSDFDTTYKGTRNIAKRIAGDLRFDENCKKNAMVRERKNNNEKTIL